MLGNKLPQVKVKQLLVGVNELKSGVGINRRELTDAVYFVIVLTRNASFIRFLQLEHPALVV